VTLLHWLLLAALLITSFLFAYINGYKDSGAVVATTITAGVLPARRALLLAALMEFIGPFLFGVAVATTIATGMVSPEVLTPIALLSALLASLFWGAFTSAMGLPSSSSHTLVGGLIGAGLAAGGPQAVRVGGLVKVMIVLFTSPLIGGAAGYWLLRLVYVLAQDATPRINRFFRLGQLVSSMTLALVHSTNDAQKAMGLMTLSLMSMGLLHEFTVPKWVVIASALGIALGTATAGMRIVRTLGYGVYRVRSVHGFCAQVSSTLVVLVAALIGGPVSTTQVVSSSIMGAGAGERVSRVRWTIARSIAVAWLVTIPITALIAAGFYLVFGTVSK